MYGTNHPQVKRSMCVTHVAWVLSLLHLRVCLYWGTCAQCLHHLYMLVASYLLRICSYFCLLKFIYFLIGADLTINEYITL